MARFNCIGLDEFALSMQEIEELPETVKDHMLSAGAEVGLAAMRHKLDTVGLVDTEQLKTSLAKKKKTGKEVSVYYEIAPYGKRNDGERNGTVGYVSEFGAPGKGIKPRPWMQPAIEEAADEIAEAEFAVYDEWLKSKNL